MSYTNIKLLSDEENRFIDENCKKNTAKCNQCRKIGYMYLSKCMPVYYIGDDCPKCGNGFLKTQNKDNKIILACDTCKEIISTAEKVE